MNEHRPEPDDLVPQDDAVIGRVFRWSVLVLALLLLLVAAGLLLVDRSAPEEQATAKNVGQVPNLERTTVAMPQVKFTDVTEQAGIRFIHNNGARGDKLLPETMGGGVAFMDYDGDGDSDLLLINSREWKPELGAPTMALYRNEGNFEFTDVTEAAGLAISLYGMAPAIGDYDNDGDPDLYVTALGSNKLLRNDNGVFTDVSKASRVSGDSDRWSSGAGFFDYDNDGNLDLFVCNYVNWSEALDVELAFSLNGRDRAYGPPTSYEGVHPYLFRNLGDGTFEDVSAQSGVQVVHPTSGRPMAKALAVTFADVDRDGHIDVFVANDTVQNFLFRNRGNGTFEEIGAVSGVGFDGAGNATGAMGIDSAHHRNDNLFALAIGNFANEMSSLYVAQRSSLQFTDEAAGEGIGSPSRRYLSFGLFFFDYDLDGFLDLLQVNGHLESEISEVQASQSYRQPAQLFWNSGPDSRSCYAEVPHERTGDLSQPIVGRGAAYADVDGDGDLDVILTQTGGRPVLLRNDQTSGHHWLRVKLVGTRSNRDGIGSWIELQLGAMIQRRQVMPTRSYLSQVEPVTTLGLGQATSIDGLSVTWPDGTVQQINIEEIEGLDREISVRQGD